MRVTFTNPAALNAADTETRRLAGVALPYGQKGFTDRGPITVDAGALKIPEELRRVKLFREHGRQVPVGFATDADDGDDALQMEFQVARTPDGDQSLLEASEGVRDALSVELDNVTIHNGHLTAGELVAVALTAVPAFAAARLTASLTDEEQAEVLDLAQQIVDATTPSEEEPTEEAPDEEAPTTEEEDRPMTEASAPAALNMTPAAAGRVDAARQRQLFAAQAAEAMRGATDAAQVNAALTDIIPSTAGTDGIFPRPAWLGELWSPEAPQRAIINAIGVSPLTSMTMDGWKWTTKPVVSPYAGEKADVPSSVAVIEPAQAVANRIAGGWDLDRIYVDFNTGFVDAFLRAAAQDYRRKSQTYFIDGHAAVVGPPAVAAADGIIDDATVLDPETTFTAAVAALVAFLVGNGANVSFIAMSSDLFSAFLALGEADVPWWLQKQGLVNLNGSTDLAGTTVAVDPGLPAATILGGDRDAVSLWETGPINVQAINIPNGGIDLGLFGYWAQQVHDADGLAVVTVDETP